MPCPLPRWIEQMLVGFFPVREAFPGFTAGRHPRLHFRGLLRLHSRYGLQGRSAPKGGLFSGAPARPVARPTRSVATMPYRQLPGWILLPLTICAVGAHVKPNGASTKPNGPVSPPRLGTRMVQHGGCRLSAALHLGCNQRVPMTAGGRASRFHRNWQPVRFYKRGCQEKTLPRRAEAVQKVA